MKFFPLLVVIIFAPVNVLLAEENQDTGAQPSLFVDLLHYAQLSNSAYDPRDAIARMAREMSSQLIMHEQVSGLDVSYFLLTDSINKTHWIAVRGTVSVKNTLVNLDLQLIPNKDIGIQLHRGFAETAKDIFQKIQPKLNKDFIIKISGHSLGGAVATVLAMYLDINNFSVTRIVTFGQPKVTNFTGSRKFAQLDILRVVTAKDFVPLLPPVDMVDVNLTDLNSISNVGLYWPLGQEIILLDKNEYSFAKGLDSMLRTTKFLNKQPDMSNLKHHQMTYYLEAIKGRQQNAKWVPYKNDFSIFSIFGDSK